MKLPHIFTNEHQAHFAVFVLTVLNSVLILLIFFVFLPSRGLLPKIIPLSAQTPTVDFNLISPVPNSTVSGTVPLVTTLTNGPKITSAELMINGQKVQAVRSQETERLTIFWDTTKFQDGKYSVKIKAGQDNKKTSYYETILTIQNNVQR